MLFFTQAYDLTKAVIAICDPIWEQNLQNVVHANIFQMTVTVAFKFCDLSKCFDPAYICCKSQLEALRERRPPWLRQIITPILPTVKMLSLGGERLPQKNHYQTTTKKK